MTNYVKIGQLIDRILNGDQLAYEELYKSTHNFMWSVIASKVSTREDIEDILQDVYLKLFTETTLTRLRSPEAFISYAKASCIHAACDFNRKRKTRPAECDLAVLETPWNVEEHCDIRTGDIERHSAYCANDSPEDYIISKILEKELISILDENDKKIYWYVKAGYSYREIGERMGMKQETVKTKYNRAKQKLAVRYQRLMAYP
jgi:RNA polymerase sigma-70 factor (ECF subfamily)